MLQFYLNNLLNFIYLFVCKPVTLEYPFRDKYIFYRFTIDAESELQSRSWSRGLPSPDDEREADLKCPEVLAYLAQRAPDAIMRLILRKPSYERTTDDLEMIYEELLHIKALAHLSNSVKRELAGVIVFEAHPTNGTICKYFFSSNNTLIYIHQ